MNRDKPWVIGEAAPDNQLLRTLQQTRAAGRMALCGYFLAGYPTPEDFYRLVRAADDLDVIEFGLPAEQPLLDGPVISDAHAIVTTQRGIGAETGMALIGGLRHTQQARFAMIYTHVGRELPGFLRLCVENAIHGVIAPDIGLDEAAYVSTIARALNLAVFMLLDARAAHDTIRQRVELADVIYLKAALGSTGQHADLTGSLYDVLKEMMGQIRAINPQIPVAVGIGVQRPEQVAALARLGVDMVIVGTKIVEQVAYGEDALVNYIRALREATIYPGKSRDD